MKKKNSCRRRIIITSLILLAGLLCIMPKRHVLTDSMKGYALRHAYAPIRGADEYYENYRVINVWKYNLSDEEYNEAYSIMLSTNTWQKISEQELHIFSSWFMESELFNGLLITNKDNIHLGDIDIASSYYCMYDIVNRQYVSGMNLEFSMRYAIFILDCSEKKYYCIDLT